MNNSKKSFFSSIRKFLSGSSAFIVLLILTILTPLIDGGHSIYDLLIMLAIVVILYTICFFAVRIWHNKRLAHFTKCSYENIETVIKKLNAKAEYSNDHICPEHNYLCSASAIMASDYYANIQNELILSDDDCAKYNLVRDNDFDKIEAEFFRNHPAGEIWIVSNALETEIKTIEELKEHPDPSLVNSMDVVKQNIINGGKYIQFIALGPQGENNTVFENRRNLYWSILPELSVKEKQIVMPIIRIDDEFSKNRNRVIDPDFEYLVKLTSTVLFIDTESEMFVQGYFCLRPDDNINAKPFEIRTVFLKMPVCMRDDYYYFLKEKKEKYYKNLAKEI